MVRNKNKKIRTFVNVIPQIEELKDLSISECKMVIGAITELFDKQLTKKGINPEEYREKYRYCNPSSSHFCPESVNDETIEFISKSYDNIIVINYFNIDNTDDISEYIQFCGPSYQTEIYYKGFGFTLVNDKFQLYAIEQDCNNNVGTFPVDTLDTFKRMGNDFIESIVNNKNLPCEKVHLVIESIR